MERVLIIKVLSHKKRQRRATDAALDAFEKQLMKRSEELTRPARLTAADYATRVNA